MFLTELVLQGVRRFASPRKLTFSQGLNVLLGGNGTGKSTVADVLIQLLFPSTNPAQIASFQESPGKGPSRAGVSFRQGDNLFRNVMDFSQGVMSLSRFNAQNSTFVPLSQDPGQIKSFFQNDLKSPGADIYRLLYHCTSDEFPSSKSQSQSSIRPAAHSAGAGMQDPQVLLREIQSLRKLQQDALKIKQIQFEIDGLHKEIFECADVMKGGEAISKKIEQVKADLDNLPPLPELPEDLEARADAYEKASKKIEHEVPQIEQEIRDLNDQLPYTAPTPLQKDMQLIIGGAMCLAAIIGGSLINGPVFGVSQNVFTIILGFVAVGGFGISIYQIFNFVSKGEAHAAIVRDVKKKEEKVRAIERKFEVETSVVRNILKTLNADSTKEMFSIIEKIQLGQSQMKTMVDQLNTRKSKPEYQKAETSLPEMKKRAAVLEQQLQLLSATPLDADVIADQIAELEDQARRAGAEVPTAAATGGDLSQNISPEFIERIGRDAFSVPTQRLAAASALALNMPMNEFVPKLLPPLDKNLGAFSFKNLSEAKIDGDGTFSVQDAEAKGRVRFEQLEPFKQDVVYFALKFTLLQFLLREFPFPLVMDSALKGFDERISPVIAKSMKFLSQQTQVLLLTDQEIYGQAADTVEKL